MTRFYHQQTQQKYSAYDSIKLTWYQKQTEANNHGQCKTTCGDSLGSVAIGINMNLMLVVVHVFALHAVIKSNKNISATKCGSLISSAPINAR